MHKYALFECENCDRASGTLSQTSLVKLIAFFKAPIAGFTDSGKKRERRKRDRMEEEGMAT
jgi:hypothetical protein